MSITCYLTRQFQNGADVQSSIETISDESLLSVSQSCAVSATTNVLANITKANVSALFISVDYDAHVNYGSTTLAMFGGIPVLWSNTEVAVSNPLASNVSSFNIVNASASDVVQFEVRVLTTA